MQDILRQVALAVVPILVAITFHEVAHGYVAYRMGDGTAKAMGRLTLNPIAHIDPIGTVLMPIMLLIFTQGQMVFGYAKPVPINPYNFKNPRKGMAISAAAGPAANLALALASLLILSYALLPLAKFLPSEAIRTVISPIAGMLRQSILINVVLASFNLIPIPPLDGGRVLAGVLPARHAYALERIERYGFIIVLILIMTGMARYFIYPLMRLFYAFLGIFSPGGSLF